VYQFVNRSGNIFHFFGMTDYQKANMFSEEISLLSGRLGTERDIIVGGGILCQGSVLVSKGHIVTEQAARGSIFVAPCDDDCQTKINEGIDKIREAIDDTIPQAAGKIDQAVFERTWYEEKRAGNERVMEIMGFSFRTDEDYKIQDFLLYEDRWQQLARLGGQTTEKWNERGVPNKVCEKTYPFPGKKWLVDEKAYKEQDLKIAKYESDGFIDKKRNEAPGLADEYKEPEFKKPEEPKKIDGNYPIVPRS
jgi:hypothetical protein